MGAGVSDIEDFVGVMGKAQRQMAACLVEITRGDRSFFLFVPLKLF